MSGWYCRQDRWYRSERTRPTAAAAPRIEQGGGGWRWRRAPCPWLCCATAAMQPPSRAQWYGMHKVWQGGTCSDSLRYAFLISESVASSGTCGTGGGTVAVRQRLYPGLFCIWWSRQAGCHAMSRPPPDRYTLRASQLTDSCRPQTVAHHTHTAAVRRGEVCAPRCVQAGTVLYLQDLERVEVFHLPHAVLHIPTGRQAAAARTGGGGC